MPQPMPQAAVIFNPTKIERSKLEVPIAAAAAEHEWAETLWFETTVEDPGAGVAKLAVRDGATVVLAAGGDGTVRSVAEGLRGTGVPLALLPTGTGNVLARNLQLKLTSLANAIEIAFTGSTRHIDLAVARIHRPDGTSNDQVFAVMAGLGIDAEIMAATKSKAKRAFGWLAYLAAGWRRMLRSERFAVAIQVDGGPIEKLRVHSVLVGNCGVMPGNVLLLPDASIDDGQLDILALQPKSKLGWLTLWRRVLIEHQLEQTKAGRIIVENSGANRIKTLTYRQGAKAKISVRDARECELDGDPFGLAVGLSITVDAGGLAVKVG